MTRALASFAFLLFVPVVACTGIVAEQQQIPTHKDPSTPGPVHSTPGAAVLTGSGEGPCAALGVTRGSTAAQPGGPCICTRRDANPAGNCPRGVGQSASATIGSEGGTITLDGQAGPSSGVPFTLTIPPTALSTPTKITVTELATPPPDGFVDWSPYYRIDPVDLVLTVPAQLKVPISNGRGSASYDANMHVFSSSASACSLEPLASSYANAGFMQANTLRLGYVIAGYADVGAATYCQ